jgi:hypothetical protein
MNGNGTGRPVGRDAPLGDLEGPYDPPWPYRCRRCGCDCGREGHPYGCPRTPDHYLLFNQPLRLCYCGQTVVLAPAWLGPCCEDTPPVRIPGGCGLCGDDRCRVCDPDDEPEAYSGGGGSWVHARCGDERFSRSPEYLASRRAKRATPLGVIAP